MDAIARTVEAGAEAWSAKLQEGLRSLVQDSSCGAGRRGRTSLDPASGAPAPGQAAMVDDWPLFPTPGIEPGLASGAEGASPGTGVSELGLENASGCNHCFLNVVIQAFWNLQSFRRRLLWAPEHPHGLAEGSPGVPDRAEESCPFCALQALFKQMQLAEGGGGALPPDDVRRALSRVYDARGRFQLGEMEDATETIEALLGVLHACNVQTPLELGRVSSSSVGNFTSGGSSCSSAEAPSEARRPSGQSAGSRHSSRSLLEAERIEEASNFGCHPACIAHEVFGVEYVDLTRCNFCGATSEPTVSSSFLYCAYVADLLAAAEAGPERRVPSRASGGPPAASLAALVPEASALPRSPASRSRRCELQELLRGLCQREVPQKCRECNSLHTVFVERWLTQQPFTFVVSLVWPSSTPSRQTLWMVLLMIRPELRLDQIFRLARPGSQAQRKHQTSAKECSGPVHGDDADAPAEAYAFRGLVCYSGMHYVALFWCWSRMKWILFDDTCVREEQDWTSVTAFIMNGQYVPTLVFFERRDCGEQPPPEESVKELARQVGELEDRQSLCSAM